MIKIVDTHLHIWDRNHLNLPWLDGDTSVLSKNYSLIDYQNSLHGDKLYNVEKAVYIEVDVLDNQKEKENEFIIDLCRNKDTLLKAAVISGDLTKESFDDYIGKYKNIDCIKGVRHVLHVPSSKPKTCLSNTFLKNVKLLGELGLVFEGCIRAEELDDLYTLARECSNTSIILNHMGIVNPDIISSANPTDEETEYKEVWIKNLKDLASLPNVACKISGLNPSDGQDIETLRIPVNTALDIFGENNVMFASNYPVCNISTKLDPWIKAVIEITKDRTKEFVNKLFYENANRIYKL
ncbi:amidohydrolase [Sebaldella sp. S0638]|uniref:amidohydrolase family protein n=1 Tax=Sebaldella sp. S0638 TaxID=2957809 RepID=UPI0020A0C221|nr:amidohydrolase family protein [Sebaldella sp. S0638]MCP1225830.1 amidohydrolase family protein [Sebaldella sp. S0638]